MYALIIYVNTSIIFPLWSWSHCNSFPCRFVTPLHIEPAFTGLSAWPFHLGLTCSNLLTFYITYSYLQNCHSVLLELGPEALLLMHSGLQVPLKFLSYWSTIFLNVSINSAFSPFQNCFCFYINIFLFSFNHIRLTKWSTEFIGTKWSDMISLVLTRDKLKSMLKYWISLCCRSLDWKMSTVL